MPVAGFTCGLPTAQVLTRFARIEPGRALPVTLTSPSSILIVLLSGHRLDNANASFMSPADREVDVAVAVPLNLQGHLCVLNGFVADVLPRPIVNLTTGFLDDTQHRD